MVWDADRVASGGASGGVQRFFVSYAGVDIGWAEWVAWTLEAAGHEALIQAWDFGPGSHFVGEMQQALAGDRRTVAVLSAAYLRSAFATEEWQAVWAADPNGAGRLLLVVRVEDCERRGLLRQVVSVDLFGVDREVARRRLLDAIAPGRRKPDVEPAFPATAGPGAVAPSPIRSAPAIFASVVRSAYLEQVRQIAPPRLVGREAELARLAAFCTAPDDAPGSAYVWWRAGAWTGKSALLSSFVLDPPPGVRAVSFFITARYAGNSDRAAFVEVVTEQLADILGELVPPFQTEGRRERLWFQWFADAAARCEARGQRLVLVVDGLDEDRGVTGPGTRTIAGLLPANPPHGARVVVAGRPDPPIPGDVPPGHPLRDPTIVQLLERSEHAAAIRADMEADLHRLRTGSPLEYELLALVTAAEGGLSGRDLKELSTDPNVTTWAIGQLLSTVAGRSFASHATRWDHADGARVYLLGHEELQREAVHAYGHKILATYRDRIHSWAEGYQRLRWPEDTPEYLIRGYLRMLLASGELTRAVEYATDRARNDFMLKLSGGDTAALTEISEAQNDILSQPSPNIGLIARLSVHRQWIVDRNSNIPISLPAVWARLGYGSRAEQLARSISNSDSEAHALAGVAAALAQAGERSHAEQIASKISNPSFQAQALAGIAAALAQAGDHARAIQIANDAGQVAALRIGNPLAKAKALADVAAALAQAGEHIRAKQVARGIASPVLRAQALAGVASALTNTGEYNLAKQAAGNAEQVARRITHPASRARALADVAAAFAQAGEHRRVEQIVSTAEQVAHGIADPHYAAPAARASQVRVLADVATALAQAGEIGRAKQSVVAAEQLSYRIGNIGNFESQAQADVAAALAQTGEFTRAERLARSITDSGFESQALADVAVSFARAGEHLGAERVARSITDPGFQSQALAGVAAALTQAGQETRAKLIAANAEQVARSSADPNSQAQALRDVAAALAQAGEHIRAEQLARSIRDSVLEAQALGDVTAALANAGEYARAEQIASSIRYPLLQAQALADVAAALANAGDHTRAEQTAAAAVAARGFERYEGWTQTLLRLAAALAQVAERTRSIQIAAAAERVARSITDRISQDWALAGVAAAFAQAGGYARAEQIASRATDPETQARALAGVAAALAQGGDYARAEQIASRATDPETQARALAAVAAALAQAGDRTGAIRFCSMALATGNWARLPISIVADVSLDAIRAFADAVMSNHSAARNGAELG
jgi:hypothetical protein